MEYPPTPSKGFTASPEPIEQLHESVQDFVFEDNDATPRPLKIEKRNVSAMSTPIRRKPVPQALPFRNASAAVESPQYVRNAAIEPIRVPARQSSRTFADKELPTAVPRAIAQAPSRGRSVSIASNASRSYSPIAHEKDLAIKKTRHTRSISDASSTSSKGVPSTAQEKFRAQNPPLNSGTTFYGPLRFDRDRNRDSWDSIHGPPPQQLKQRAATTGTYLNTKPASPLSPLSPLNSVEPPGPATSLVQLNTAHETVPASKTTSQKDVRTRESRSKSLGNQNEASLPQRTDSFKTKNFSKLFQNPSKDRGNTHPEPKIMTILSNKLQKVIDARSAGATPQIGDVRPASASSVYSDDSAKRDKRLSVLPVPRSRITSFMEVHSPEKKALFGAGMTATRIALPACAQVLGVGLRIFPEVDSIDVSQGKSIWIAVEAEGMISTKSTKGSPLEGKGRIDAVVVIDTTSFMSAETFTSSCEMAITIASLLDDKKDRLAILTTESHKSRHENGDHILAKLLGSSVCRARGSIGWLREHRKEPTPDEGAIDKAVSDAIEILSFPGFESERTARQGVVYGHVFVVSPNVAGDHLQGTDYVKVHVIHPGFIPWKGNTDFSNGWQLRSMYPQHLFSTALCHDFGGIPSRLRALIHHCRSGSSPGEVEDLEFVIKPARNCEVEHVLGSTSVKILRPGQMASLFVKLKVGELILDDPEDPFMSSYPRTPTGLFEELDTLLGKAVVDLLSVEVTYRNRLLVAESEVTTSASAQVKRITAQSQQCSEWNIHPAFRSPERSPNGNLNTSLAEVQKRLAFWLAGEQEPKKSIKAIEGMCIELSEGRQTGSERFIKQVLQELRFQKVVVDRWDLDMGDGDDGRVFDQKMWRRRVSTPVVVATGLKTPIAGPSNMSSVVKKTTSRGILKTPVSEGVVLNLFGTPTRRNRVAKRSGGNERAIVTIEKVAGSSSGSSGGGGGSSGGGSSGGGIEALNLHPRTPSGKHMPADAARKIWKSMRQDSKGEHGGEYGSHKGGDVGLGIDWMGTMRHEGRGGNRNGWVAPAATGGGGEMERIRDMAVRNKRSVGADTLMSFGDAARMGRGEGDAAPWL
ncbi:MAG: hypothetical protein M1812_007396 [Candelaria pacifica]|nr:MAG: hypothetical protein M1812_007396 [Candelaria pacifica]